MKNRIELLKEDIEYTLKISRRARRMRLSIYCDGNFVVTAPLNMRADTIEQFILKKSRWIINKLNYYKSISGQVFMRGTGNDYVKHKEQAFLLVRRRIEYFNRNYGFKFNQIRIKNQKTCWGSCSKKANLNFNYKIALLPEKLADYIIVHELCHLKEFNHSQRFWDLVAGGIPDYLEVRKELKKSGARFV